MRQEQHHTTQPLSKSWTKRTIHSTLYDGGKVVMSRGEGSKNLYFKKPSSSIIPSEDDDNDNNINSIVDTKATPFLAALCNGDVALIDADRGVKARTIRFGVDDIENENSAHEQQAATDDDNNNFFDTADESSPLSDPESITTFSLSYNDADMVTAHRSGILRHYDVSTGDLKRTIGRAHDLPVRVMEHHSSGVFLATGSVDGFLKVWDMRGGYCTHSFQFPKGISAISWCPGATTLILAAGCDDGTIRLYDLKQANKSSSNIVLLDVKDHVSSITSICWTEDEAAWMFTSGRDSVVHLYERVEDMPQQQQQQQQRASKKQKRNQKFKNIHTSLSYTRIKTFPMYEQIEGMELISNTTDAVTFCTAGSMGRVKTWKVLRGASSTSGSTNTSSNMIAEIENVALQPEGESFGEKRGGYLHLIQGNHHVFDGLIAIDAEHNLSFIEHEQLSSSSMHTERIMIGCNDEIIDLKVLKNVTATAEEREATTKIVVATNSAQVRIFDTDTFSCRVLNGHTDIVLSIDVSPCGRLISTCGKDRTMRLWDASSCVCLATAVGHTEAVGAAALSKKVGKYNVGGKAGKSGAGAFVVTCSKDKTLKRWCLPSADELLEVANNDDDYSIVQLKAIGSVRAHEKDINVVGIAPNDSVIVTGSQDKTAKIWNTTDLSLKGTLKGHKRGIWDCQFSSFDRVVATASGDHTVKLWSLNNFSCVRTFQGHTASVLRVRFLSGGLQLASSGADGLVKLWTVRTFECEATMDSHTDRVWALDMSSDGKLLISGGADSRIVVWDDNTKEIEDAERAVEEENILMEQKLANHLRHKEFDEALEMVLKLDKPRQALKVITALVENDLQAGLDPCSSLKKHVSGWEMDKTAQILRYSRDWNTRARNSDVAMIVVRAIVSAIPTNTLASVDGVPEILAGIIPYAERHFERLDKLISSSYLIDYTLMSMGSLMEEGDDEENTNWEAKCKLVLTQKPKKPNNMLLSESEPESSDDEVVTIGDSDDSDDDAMSDSS